MQQGFPKHIPTKFKIVILLQIRLVFLPWSPDWQNIHHNPAVQSPPCTPTSMSSRCPWTP